MLEVHVEPKQCFVIAPIGKAETEVRKRSDQVLKHIIRPAAKECGYEAVRADEISEVGLITSQVIQRVIDDPIVIADLSGHNPNVFYELALRHALRRPCIQLIDVNETIPFDVGGIRTVQIDHRDLDAVERSRADIVGHINSIEASPGEVETPIAVAIDLQELRRSDNPIEKSNAEILESLAEIRRSLTQLLKRRTNLAQERDYAEVRHQLKIMLEEGLIDRSVAAGFMTRATSSAFDRWITQVIENSPTARAFPSGESYYDEEPF